LRFLIDLAAEREHCRAAAAIATHYHQLRAGEEIGQWVRVDLLHVHATEIELQVSQ